MPWARTKFNTGNCTWTCTTLFFLHCNVSNLWCLEGEASPREQNITTVTGWLAIQCKCSSLGILTAPQHISSQWIQRRQSNDRATEHVISFDTRELLHIHRKERKTFAYLAFQLQRERWRTSGEKVFLSHKAEILAKSDWNISWILYH